jgi:glyoxylase-like metal-dependent hydrolase (beta-lactamase superfamily II)
MQSVTYQLNEVAPGIYQLKMPLPFRLDHINLYLLEDIDGWILIDTGLNTKTSQELWEQFINTFASRSYWDGSLVVDPARCAGIYVAGRLEYGSVSVGK